MAMEVDQVSLQFSEPLVGPRAIPADTLRNRLEALHQELESVEQGCVELESLDTVARDLAHKKVLEHNQPKVTAVACACIVDILRLYAPNPPYAPAILTRIFTALLHQFRGMTRNNDNFSFQFYALESLASVKTVILVADLNNAESLATEYFSIFFQAAEHQLPHNVLRCMTDILSQIAAEVPLSLDTIEMLLLKISNTDRLDPIFAMASGVCQASPDALQKRTCQYFTDAFMTADTSDEDSMDDLKKTHKLIRDVYPVAPVLLLNVIPLVEEELSLDVLRVRILATETLGNMFASKTSKLFSEYPSIWHEWQGRRNDKAAAIRIRWLELAAEIYKSHPEHAGNELSDLLTYFGEMIVDPEEKVRMAACETFGSLDLAVVIDHVSKDDLLALGKRCMDKKQAVRKQAMATLGSMYRAVCHQLHDSAIMDKFGWIPSMLLNLTYVGMPEITTTMEEMLVTYIFPEQVHNQDRVDRLVHVVMSLDKKAKDALWNYMQRAKKHIDAMEKFLTFVENEFSEAVDLGDYTETNANLLIKGVADQFHDVNQVTAFLTLVRTGDDTTLVRSLHNALTVENEYGRLCSAQKSLISRVKTLSPNDVTTCNWLLNRGHLMIMNKSNISYLFALLRQTRGNRHSNIQDRSDAAQFMLKNAATYFPSMCQSFVEDAISNISNADSGPLVDVSLEFIAAVATAKPEQIALTDRAVSRLISYANNGSKQQSEPATLVLCHAMDSTEATQELIKELELNVNLNNSNLVAVLTSASIVAKHKPALLDSLVDDLFDFILADMLSQDTVANDPENPDWQEYEDLPAQSQQKLAAMPVLINYLVGIVKTHENEPLTQRELDLTNKVVALLWELLVVSNDVAKEREICAAEASRMRIMAAETLMSFADIKSFASMVQVPEYENIGRRLMQDECYKVRLGFANAVMVGLQTNRLHHRYYTYLFLGAHEPEHFLFERIERFIKSYLSKFASVPSAKWMIEMKLIPFVHLLAHHSDFTDPTSEEDILEVSLYIKFFVACIATVDNISYLYHVAQTLKIAVDVTDRDASLKTHVLADLASALIVHRAERQHWIINHDAHKIDLYNHLYTPLPPGNHQKKALRNSYVSEALLKKILAANRAKR